MKCQPLNFDVRIPTLYTYMSTSLVAPLEFNPWSILHSDQEKSTLVNIYYFLYYLFSNMLTAIVNTSSYSLPKD